MFKMNKKQCGSVVSTVKPHRLQYFCVDSPHVSVCFLPVFNDMLPANVGECVHLTSDVARNSTFTYVLYLGNGLNDLSNSSYYTSTPLAVLFTVRIYITKYNALLKIVS